MSGKIAKFVRPVNGVRVQQRRADGYVDATAMSKAYFSGTGQRRDVSEWLSNERTKETIKHLSLKTGIPAFKLVEAVPGRYGGTWIHPKLAVRFAIWLSDDFGYLVEQWVEEWLTTGRNPIEVNPDQEYITWQQRHDIRVFLKDFLRPELMDAVVSWAIAHGGNPITMAAAVHDAMNERIQGLKSQQIKLLHGLPLATLIRDHFEATPLVAYAAINKLAKNAIEDRGVEPVQAVHEACDCYLGANYVPHPVPIAENLYVQGQRLKQARHQRRLRQGVQLDLWGNNQVS